MIYFIWSFNYDHNYQMEKSRNEKLIMLTIVMSFVMSFIVNMLASFLYPPDFSGEFPVYHPDWAMLLQVAGAMLLVALTVIAMKAEEEKQILAAAGFTAIAISFGISVMSFLDLAEIATFEQYESSFRVTTSSNFLLVPASVLIASYDRFKKWVRYFTVLSVIPYLIASIMFLSGVRDYHQLEKVIITGVVFISLSWLLWAFNIYDNYRIDHRSRLL